MQRRLIVLAFTPAVARDERKRATVSGVAVSASRPRALHQVLKMRQSERWARRVPADFSCSANERAASISAVARVAGIEAAVTGVKAFTAGGHPKRYRNLK